MPKNPTALGRDYVLTAFEKESDLHWIAPEPSVRYRYDNATNQIWVNGELKGEAERKKMDVAFAIIMKDVKEGKATYEE